jgi:hypothetical protein
MTFRTRLTATVAALAVALLPLLAEPAYAAEPPVAVTWGVRPAAATGPDTRSAFSYSVKAGVEIQDYLGVSNLGSTTTTFTTYATDATNDVKSGGFSLLPSGEKPVDLGSWISLRSATVTIAPGQEARIPITILVPSDAHPGDHTAGLIASIFRTGVASHGKQITVEERVAARVYLHVDGAVAINTAASGLTSTFSGSLNPFGSGTNTLSYAVTNTGNLRTDIAQQITIRGPFGIVLGHILGARITNLLPGEHVQEKLHTTGIPAAFLLWSTVTLTTLPPTDAITAGTTLTDRGTAAAQTAAPAYPTFSSDTLTGAVPWSLLLLVLLVGAAIWLLLRYIAVSRDQVYRAIDLAAEQARTATPTRTGIPPTNPITGNSISKEPRA